MELSSPQGPRAVNKLVGPDREKYHMTVWEWSLWYAIVGKLFLDEHEEAGRVRPAFALECGTKLLEENFPDGVPNWRYLP